MRRIGGYEVGEKLGDGGMASVYLASRAVGGAVALKVLAPQLARDPVYVTMFEDEAVLLKKLSHPTTVQFYASGEDAGQYFIAMELLIGHSLLRAWQAFQLRESRFPLEVAVYIGARVAMGLHHAHQLKMPSGELENVVHRDVNPSNVYVTLDGRVKVIDFGLARNETRITQTVTGIVKGKLAYLAPEQIDGRAVDRRADIFALGTTLWEITADRRLFKQVGDLDTVRAISACEVPDPRDLVPGYPAALWQVLRRALSRNPDERYATAEEMGHELEHVLTTMQAAVTPSTIAALMGKISAWGAS